jgi:hypothetical protein
MATGAEATARIAQVTGALSANVFRTARTLREAGKDLWPAAGKGGGRAAAHVERRHLTNLAIALAVSEPLLAVKFIPVYRSLRADKPERHALTRDSGQAASLLATNDLFNGKRRLGDELDRLLDVLPKGRVSDELECAGLYFEFFIEQRVPRVVVGHHVFDAHDDLTKPEIRWLYRRADASPDRAFDPQFNFLPRLLITRTALIPVSLFTIMAELWVDTQQHHAITATRRPRRPAVLVKE